MALRNFNKAEIQKLNKIFVVIVRQSSEHRAKKGKTLAPGFKTKPNAATVDKDYIGPADRISNLRPVVRHVPENETPLQKELRLARIDTEEWNQKFWTNHNQRFIAEKEAFIKINKQPNEDTVSADKMSEFYKTFLDSNWKSHFDYNRQWYKRNLQILLLSYRTKFEFLQRLRR